ncbi:MAG: triose-phosphate isomerase [Bacteroidota bacterium]
MKRNITAAGNWKMNTTLEEGLTLAQALVDQTEPGSVNVILAPPYTHLQAIGEIIKSSPHIHLAAQNCHEKEKGAYTGEISIDMLLSVGVEYVILGHSERREYFGESNALLAEKTVAALAKGLHPIFCCGEPLEIREKGTHVAYVEKQLRESLFELSGEQFAQLIIAYEPIWAIGTGLTASPEQAQEMQAAIRALLAGHFGTEAADQCSILYGGSVKSGNAAALFGQPDVDGGLVGGASLKAADFTQIIAAGA